MSQRFEMAWYLTEMPDHDNLCQMLARLRALLPGVVDRYEFMNWAGKERRGKYAEHTLREKLGSVPTPDLNFVAIHSKLKPEDRNVPVNDIRVGHRFYGGNPLAGVYVYLPMTDVTDGSELCRRAYDVISSHADLRYGFGVGAPQNNHDFIYGPAMLLYVDRKTDGYKVVEDLCDRLMKSEATLNPLIEGRMVRSVYPLNIVSASLADDIRHTLKAERITKTGTFSELSGGKILWCVSDVALRAEMFNALHSAGMTLEHGWLDLERYRPRFATRDDIT